MLKPLLTAAVLLSLALGTAPADAALIKPGKNKAEASPAALCNPKPAEGDLILPMPNGLHMVLRAVAIPADNLLDDKRFSMGLTTTDDSRSYYEKQTSAHVGAPFRHEDLPAAWRGSIAADEAGMFSYYFIGKYEITNAQWAAVMGEPCPEHADKPKTKISWYDVQQFLRRYNEWLLSKHAPSLPSIDGLPGFLRLPTEEEWEFAARGGNLPPELQEGVDFILEDGRKVEDYAVFGRRASCVPIGTRLPNRLGLYDMAGNVEELVQSAFRFTVTDSLAGGGLVRRLHGAEGGLLSKGGSFLSIAKEDVYPGKRVEMPMFVKQGEAYQSFCTRSLGVRLVLSSINIPGSGRTRNIEKAQAALSGVTEKKRPAAPAPAVPGPTATADSLVTIDPEGDPLTELEKIYSATASPLVKSNLDQLRDLLKDSNAALSRERDANLMNALRSGAYQGDSLRNIAWRCFQFDSLKQMVRNAPKEVLAAYEKKVRDGYQNLKVSTNFYRVSVKEIAAYPSADVAKKTALLLKEYVGDGILNANLRENISCFADHVRFASTQGANRLTNMMIWESFIEKDILEVLKRLEKEQKNKDKRKI